MQRLKRKETVGLYILSYVFVIYGL